MKDCLLYCVSLGLALSLATPMAASAAAAPAPGGDFLNVNKAFNFHVTAPNPQTLRVHFRIHDGYYLYRRQFHFALVDPPQGLHIKDTRIPPGHKKHDKYFGEVETYRHKARATLHLSGASPHNGPLKLRVRYQGCADKGICYPPQKHLVSVDLPQQAGPAQHKNNPPPPRGQGSKQARVAALIGHANLAWTALTFLGFGLLLAFTPCVLPMIPILSGIIAGQGERSSAPRGFLLSLSYVLAMAAAYTVFGVIAGLAGQNLQAALQAPVAIAAFAAVFVLLALSLFGFYEIQLPAALRHRLNNVSARQSGGSPAGAAIMGFIAALVVGPCITPALAGALLYIGQSGNAALGGMALFALGLGMGLPLVALGTLGGHWLPRAGAWMARVQHVFGVVFLGVAIWMLARILPAPATLGLWAALFLVSGIYLGALEPLGQGAGGWRRLWKGSGVAALVYGIILATGAASGGSDPLQPLSGIGLQSPPSRESTEKNTSLDFQPVGNLRDMRAALSSAASEGKPAMLEFDADWCISCKHIKRYVFTDPQVRRLLSRLILLRTDVTQENRSSRMLMRRLNVVGPPTFVFFGKNGDELRARRLVGEADKAAFIAHLQNILNRG